MKTKISLRFVCMLTLFLLTGFHAFTQQPQYPKPENVSEQIARGSAPANYTYKVFQAPNKMYGFNILKNGKFIFHQPASIVSASSYYPALATKENAEKAAQFSIDKIKKGQQPAMLTNDEVKKIITQ